MSFFEVTRFFDRIERPKSAEKTNTTYKLMDMVFSQNTRKFCYPFVTFTLSETQKNYLKY